MAVNIQSFNLSSKLQTVFEIKAFLLALFLIFTCLLAFSTHAIEQSSSGSSQRSAEAFSSSPTYQALLQSPRLSYVDTNLGLSQDSIQALVIDQEGFLWMATEEGLDRYDGNSIIHVPGTNDILIGNPIYNMIEFNERFLILSTGMSGVLKFDKYSGETEVLLSVPYRFDDNWLQYSDAIIVENGTSILVALQEEIHRVNVQDNSSDIIFKLSDSQLDNYELIRTIYAHDNTLFVGTTYALWAFDVNTKILHRIMHAPDLTGNSANVKQLFSPDGKTLWIGTVEGFFKLDIQATLKHVYENWEKPPIDIIDPIRNIWAISRADDGNIYVGTDIGLFRTNALGEHFRYLFEPIKDSQILSSTDIMRLAIDKAGNVWAGTLRSGAFLWSPNSLVFNNIYAAKFNESTFNLSDNTVYAIHQQSSESLWIGTDNGLNHFNLGSGEVEHYLKSEQAQTDYSRSHIVQIEPSTRNRLWVLSANGIFEFDTERAQALPNERFSQAIQALFNNYADSIEMQSSSLMWLTNEEGIFQIDLSKNNIVQLDTSGSEISKKTGNYRSFLGIDKQSNQLIVSGSGRLWGIEIDTKEITLLHDARIVGATVWDKPSAWLRDADNNVWLAYVGVGIFKLNGNSFAQLDFYHKGNRLPTNMVYGLYSDRNRDIWFSSHSGIHVLSPDTLSVQSFGFIHGLSSSEFNEGAHSALADGRIVYGGNQGFTMFNPERLKSLQERRTLQPVITGIELASRDLALPFTNLSGQSIELGPEDIGLSIKYSMLNFDRSSLNRYQYRIINNGKITNYPLVRSNEIILPTLSPGRYTIEISNANSVNEAGQSAFVHVNVRYPDFVSPLALFAYALILFTVIGVYLLKRHKTQQILARANQQVLEYNARLTDALLASNSHIWEWQSDTNTLVAARNTAELALDYESIDFNDYLALIDSEDKERVQKKWERFLAGHTTQLDVTYCIQSKNGNKLWYRDVGSLKELKFGVKMVKGTYTNLTASKADKEKLKLFGEAFKQTRDWVLIYDKHIQPIAANPSFMHAFGIDKRRSIAEQVTRVSKQYKHELKLLATQLVNLRPSERFKTEASLKINQRTMTVLADINAVANKENALEIDHYLCIFTDITDQIKAQKELKQLVNYDALTGLSNRSLLLERLRHSIQYASRLKDKLAVLFIDLDRFKPVNDSFGHPSGDLVLKEVANRLTQKYAEQHSVARIGGDEFVVVLSEFGDKEALNETATDILRTITQPISIGHNYVTLSASIGIALFPDHGSKPEDLIRNADIAMFSAKKNGKNCYEYYLDEMNKKVHANIILENDIKAALAERKFENYYQAIVDLNSGKTVGFELLMRWQNRGQFIAPNIFIPLAEQIGCIIPMTDIAIEQTIKDIAAWRKEGFEGYVAINLSAKHFNQSFNARAIIAQLDKYALPIECIRFEITEGLLMENSAKSIAYMEELRQMGFKISLDDFGTGYSSLRYLKDFPIDVLKIDKSFVDDVISDEGTQSIVYSTLVMAELLKLDTVAEGIETQEQLQYFVQSQCKFGQGYFFAKPQPFKQTKTLLHRRFFEHAEQKEGKVISLRTLPSKPD